MLFPKGPVALTYQARGGLDLAATSPGSWAPAAGWLVQPYGPCVAHWRPLWSYNFYPTGWDAGLCLCGSGPGRGPDCSPGFGTIWGSLSQPPRVPPFFTLLFRDSRLHRGPRPLTSPAVHSPDRTEGQLSLGELLDLNSRKMPFSVVPVHTHTEGIFFKGGCRPEMAALAFEGREQHGHLGFLSKAHLDHQCHRCLLGWHSQPRAWPSDPLLAEDAAFRELRLARKEAAVGSRKLPLL